MLTQARSDGAAPRNELHRMQDDEDRSIAAAARATFWFVAIVFLLLWAGVSEAAPGNAASQIHCVQSG